MKKIILTTVFYLCLFSGFLGLASPGSLPPVKGNKLPHFVLPIPDNQAEKNYLGLSGKGYFKISQVKGNALIIQVLNVYCPGCQSMVTTMTKVYHLIQNDGELKGQIKLIGIFAGNSSKEVDYFKEGHRLPFPVFPDEDYKIHRALGEVRTPYLICTLKDHFGNCQVVHTRSKGFTETEEKSLLESMLEVFGFNGKDSSLTGKKLSVKAMDDDAKK